MLLAIWDNGAWENWAIWAGVMVAAYLLVMWIAALYWTYRDASARSRDPVMHGIAVAAVFIFNLPGLLLYLILRPKTTLTEHYEHKLEAEALLHEIQDQPACPQCRRKIESDFLSCPYCRASLRSACEACGRALAFGWVVCPYCGADRHQPMPEPARRPAGAPTAEQAASSVNVRQLAQSPPPKRASTATYTPPAPKPGSDTASAAESVKEV